MRAVRALVHGDWTRFAPCGTETAGPRTVQQNDDGMWCAAKPLRGLKKGMDSIHFCSQNFEYRADIGQSSTSLQLETHTHKGDWGRIFKVSFTGIWMHRRSSRKIWSMRSFGPAGHASEVVFLYFRPAALRSTRNRRLCT